MEERNKQTAKEQELWGLLGVRRIIAFRVLKPFFQPVGGFGLAPRILIIRGLEALR